MEKKELEARISAALDRHQYCSLGTVEGNRPKVRYMALFHEGLNIHLATSRKTQKVDELEANPNVYLLFGYDGSWPSDVVEIEGTCSISKDESLRAKVWREDLKHWFYGPDDPDYVILDIDPVRIEFTEKGSERRIWEREKAGVR
ncbi:general stress protein [Paenibacillus sambharensis]|uniref:General stress protein n=1 Tax=Paenibacillus sambharensis TaxID=1803190 RepID=A0A2W1LHU1_9BACL|nr:pyridoxamine 5'-phosphate oxidase family protein [Paenibacillus sambharensis]PZD94622.1 general stress protein [Paenibacillus sambharensis]